MKKVFFGWVFPILFILTSTGFADSANINTKSGLSYEILEEKITDTPLMTGVRMHILISGDITEEKIKTLLNDIYTSTINRGYFRNKQYTPVFIYAYISKEHYQSGMGQWIGMISKLGDETSSTIRVREAQIAQIGARPEEKFGLPESKRKEIFWELVKLEDKSMIEADKVYPLLKGDEPDFSREKLVTQMKKNYELQTKLYEDYEKELAAKHGLTLEQLKEIKLEAMSKEWALPPMPPELSE